VLERERWLIRITGVVQGVGFRPHVYVLASRFRLTGWVRNSASGVTIEVEGSPDRLGAFLEELLAGPPRMARIDGWTRATLPPVGDASPDGVEGSFSIRESGEGDDGRTVLISPDVAICLDCRREILDPADRRHLYPFTNCTNCGPRFTIIEDVPYDRRKTTMRAFDMCAECDREYRDPANRRFHAQPNACSACGPGMELLDRAGRPIGGDWLTQTRSLLAAGHILALKGLGGFHLACDAANDVVVAELRRRKRRPRKPFAVMVRDAATVRTFARLSPEEENLLYSPAAPIVILERIRDGTAAASVAPGLAPGLGTIGVMAPYTPLHALIMGAGGDAGGGECGCGAGDGEARGGGAPPVLVMTSGNVSDLPLVKDNPVALADLAPIADFFLTHNRDIRHRCDDSLVRVVEGETHVYRRSRGFVPQPLTVPVPAPGQGDQVPVILGAGAEIKNTFCLLRGDQAFLSPHVGEVGLREGLEHYADALETMEGMAFARAGAVAFDPHPGFAVSAVARDLRPGPAVAVYHHHAHLASVMAENGLTGEIVGIIADGAGYGEDGTIWGGEVLAGGYRSYRRLFHLAPVRLPGGDRAIEDPVRMALAYLMAALGPAAGLAAAEAVFPARATDLGVVARMIETGFNSPWTTSCGRLFDAVSALLGITAVATYEGQAAVELSELAETAVLPDPFPFELRGDVLDVTAMIRELAAAVTAAAGGNRATLAARFQETVARAFVRAAVEAARATGLTRVGLSGGVFANRVVFTRCIQELRRAGLETYYHRRVPANDGGLSLGQAVVARWRLQGGA
jgi:hydrogenase maturation protein HypF